MKLSKLQEIVLKNVSIININRANEILRNNELIKLNVHKVDNFYNIYGNFKSGHRLQSYSAHLKIDFKEEKIIFGICNCKIFKQGILNNKSYLCEHLVALGLKFVEQVKKKLNKGVNKEDVSPSKHIISQLESVKSINLALNRSNEEDKRQKLKIEVLIKSVKEQENLTFDVSFFVGNSKMYPVMNIEEFINKLINNEEYRIGKGLVYNNDKFYFSREDEKLLDYIYEYNLMCKKNTNKNSINISNYILPRLLNYMNNKKVKFNYNYQSYISEVKNQDLPLTFTLKKIKEHYVLSTKKIFPNPLNKKMNVFFYDRNIYMPSKKQIEIYKIFYDNLKKMGKLSLKKTLVIMNLIH